MSEFIDLTKEEIEVFEQFAKANIPQPINPEFKYVVTGKDLIYLLYKRAHIKNNIRESGKAPEFDER